jgi:hypothetical protein
MLAELLLAAAPGSIRAPRYSTPQMSHFSNVRTKFLDKDTLAKSLNDLGFTVIVADDDELLPVRGYEGKEELADVVIQQENGYDIGFKRNGKEFELVSDLEYWGSSEPVDAFLSKLTKRYAVNTILEKAGEENFQISDFAEDPTGKVTMKLQRQR